jgi:VWFA-related protein
MATRLHHARAAARALVSSLGTSDRLSIGSFGEEIAMSPLVTSDKRTLNRILAEELWPSRYGSPVWTALRVGVLSMSNESQRRVVVIITDGDVAERGSSKEEVIGDLHRHDCTLYAIGFQPSGLSNGLKDVAEETGGAYREIRTSPAMDLAAEMQSALDDLRSQYVIGFVPRVQDGKFHSLTVQSTIAGARVRARRGYIAPRSR